MSIQKSIKIHADAKGIIKKFVSFVSLDVQKSSSDYADLSELCPGDKACHVAISASPWGYILAGIVFS